MANTSLGYTDAEMLEYLNNYSDLKGAFGSDVAAARKHYDEYGAREGRVIGAKDDYFDTNKFEQLLQRLEGSKGRQQRQKSIEGRRDIYAQGLAGMMSNF